MKNAIIKNSSFVVMLIFFTSVISLSDKAMADDGKLYPGTFCQFRTGQKDQDDKAITRRHFRVSQHGKIRNAASDTMQVACPVIRDVQGKSPVFASVLAETTGSERVRCDVRAYRPNARDLIKNTGFVEAGKANPNSFDVIVFPSLFQVPTKQTLNIFSGAMYMIICEIPPNGSILSYYFSENS